MTRKYRRRGKNSLIHAIKEADWTLNPDTVREIVAVILLVLGIITLLGIFGLAGSFGSFFSRLSTDLFGVLGWAMPAVFLGYAIVLLWPSRFQVKPISVVGVALALVFFSALITPFGGLLGSSIKKLFESFVGTYASLILLFALTIVSILIIFNTSLKNLWERLAPNSDQVKVNEPRASVFTTLRARNQMQQPQVVAAQRTFDQAWNFPPVDLLDQSTGKAAAGNIAKNVEIIQKTLKDFNVDVSMGDVNIGPTVTQYSLKPAEGVKLNNITSRSNDLSLALAVHPIRIEAPIPGKSAVGIEIPNKVTAIVSLREILDSEEFKSTKSNLSLAMGRDVAGTSYVADLKQMPHLLIAGSTGSGKSVAINSMIISLLYQNSPSDLRFILVDPKRVEFTHYNNIPHLLCPVVFDVDKTVSALRWAVSEMDRRFRLLQETGRRNIEAYNTDAPNGRMPYIVIVIDELADLMAQAGNEVEAAIVRLAQMARAVGIHLIVATQRPSVDVITGLIKANITNRVAFAVASQIDSRTILDMTGAERLLGKGDMLYLSNDLGKPKRIQGVLVTDKEIDKVTEFLKSQSLPQYDDSILAYRSGAHEGSSGEMLGEDDLYEDAKETVVMAGKASASLLQRRLRVGYARAARLLDMLEEDGIIGPAEGAKPRDVLIDPVALDHERSQTRMPMNETYHQGVQTQGFFKPYANQPPMSPQNQYNQMPPNMPLNEPDEIEEIKLK
jgi:S-DNA-T family DNA segregation ATPase FtsK/SpoIIIE